MLSVVVDVKMVGYDPAVSEMPKFAYGLAGGMSGFLTRAVTQPLDVIKIRLQVTLLLLSRVWIPGRVFSFPGIGNQEMSFQGFPGAREWRLLQYY